MLYIILSSFHFAILFEIHLITQTQITFKSSISNLCIKLRTNGKQVILDYLSNIVWGHLSYKLIRTWSCKTGL